MPRNHFTRTIRKRERMQLAAQEMQLMQLHYQLRSKMTEPSVELPLTTEKDRRSARLAQKRLHKPVRQERITDTRIEGSTHHADH